MKDSLAKAEEWAVKAQQLAQKVDKKNIPENAAYATIDDMQMERFNDDF